LSWHRHRSLRSTSYTPGETIPLSACAQGEAKAAVCVRVRCMVCSAQYDGIAKKLCEFNAVVGAAAVDEAALVALVDRLKADPAAAATLTEAELQLTDRLLQWPAAQVCHSRIYRVHPNVAANSCLATVDPTVCSVPRPLLPASALLRLTPMEDVVSCAPPQLFPALDLVRLLVLAQPFAQRAAAAGGTPLHNALAAAAAPPLVAASLLTALRLLANCARQPALHPWLMQVYLPEHRT
jgi:hypothetical protein